MDAGFKNIQRLLHVFINYSYSSISLERKEYIKNRGGIMKLTYPVWETKKSP